MFKKILIVEDSKVQSQMYKMIFSNYPGCQLFFASNGIEGMDSLVFQEGIDLIISDLYMPKMDGLTFLKEVSREGYSHIPVIISSAEGNDHMIRKTFELGAKGYIKKPWEPGQIFDLINRIEVMIDNKRSSAMTQF